MVHPRLRAFAWIREGRTGRYHHLRIHRHCLRAQSWSPDQPVSFCHFWHCTLHQLTADCLLLYRSWVNPGDLGKRNLEVVRLWRVDGERDETEIGSHH
jgi:hypothetical protein